MKTKPTPQQIAAEIKWLEDNKTKIPHRTIFGGNNWDDIDAQIEVLKNDLSEDAIAKRSHFEDDDDGRAEDDSLWGTSAGESATYARQWMDGEEPESPSDGWKPLLQKPAAPAKPAKAKKRK